LELNTLYRRAKRGIREDAKLYVVAVSSLAVAFLCLATALLGVVNLTELAERWGRTHRMTVYLRDDAQQTDVDRLYKALSGMPAVKRAEYLTSEAARAQFLKDAMATSTLTDLPAQVFPASIEVEFVPAVSDKRIQEVGQQVAAFKAAVDEVDTYKSWFERLGALLSAGRKAVAVFAGLVLICAFAVVSNTIRLAVANRRDEIEVLKMCGATDSFVRGPFVVEGALQGLIAAALSVLILFAAYVALRTPLNSALAPLGGMRLVFLSPWLVSTVLFSGALSGALGSAISIRRYMSV
jgi:cell division transport system permease protein